MAKYYYNVFKNGELVMEKVTSKEICNQLGFRKQNGGEEPESSYYDRSLSRFTPQMLAEWRTMNARYGKKVGNV